MEKWACEICEERKMIPSELTEMELINDGAKVAGAPRYYTAAHRKTKGTVYSLNIYCPLL